MTLLKRIQQGANWPNAGKEKKSVKQVVFEHLLGDEGPTPDWPDEASLRRKARPLLKAALSEQNVEMPEAERKAFLDAIMAELQALGPLALWLEDEYILDIMAVNHEKTYVTRKGVVQLSPLRFRDEEHLRRVINYLIAPLNGQLDESSPLFEGRLPDSRFYYGYWLVSAAVPPTAVDGATLTVRKFFRFFLTVQNTIDYGSATVEMMEFLRACVIAGLNILVAGEINSGRTTALNILAGFIPGSERIVTVEQPAQLKLAQQHVIGLQVSPVANWGQPNLRDLLRHALRMRPDRLVVGDLQGGEAHDLIEAIGRGHSGVLSALRATSPDDALARLETLCQMAGAEWPSSVIRDRIASDLHLVVFIERLRDGSRKLTHISEVQGLENGEVQLADIFEFEQTGIEDRKILGQFRATGIRPKNLQLLDDANIRLWQLVHGINAEGADKFRDRSRRVDAAFPARVAVGETAILRVGIGPVGEDNDNEPVPTAFPVNPHTGQPEKIEIECSIGASSFDVDIRKQGLLLDPQGAPTSAQFALTARKEGSTGVNVTAYWGRQSLGHVWLETVIAPEDSAPEGAEIETASGSTFFALTMADSSFRPWYEPS